MGLQRKIRECSGARASGDGASWLSLLSSGPPSWSAKQPMVAGAAGGGVLAGLRHRRHGPLHLRAEFGGRSRSQQRSQSVAVGHGRVLRSGLCRPGGGGQRLHRQLAGGSHRLLLGVEEKEGRWALGLPAYLVRDSTKP